MKYLISETAGSIQGPLNYYRTSKLRFEEEQAGRPATSSKTRPEIHPFAILAPNLPIAYKKGLPVLHLRGTDDTTSPESRTGIMRKLLPWGKIITYEGTGHWLMLERKAEVTRDVLDWLTDVVLKSKL
jgi:soluble epoxide hydrolase/lipid-phosphate phosphatase